MTGDYILGVGSQIMASIDNPDVIQILSQVEALLTVISLLFLLYLFFKGVLTVS